ncbi:MAG: FecR domain-containing protein [Acidobacteriia bacterium]|nr:FecR domain-containing protein [Terriglobia bacterium]
MSSSSSKPGIHVAWKTVTYRSVALAMLFAAVVLFIGMNFAFPQFTQKGVKSVSNLGNSLLEMIAGAGTKTKSGSVNSQQAHITALDGTVRVKKASSNSWVTADYNVPLEKGDVVQTGSEGMAKIVFSDGTNYTVKQDSLIVIEENSANDQQQTNVSVAVSTGTVDLTTATYVQGSKSQVIVAGATASLAPDSAAMVHNDPKADQHEILVKKGSGEISRNGEVVHLADWEKVAFQSQSPRMAKVKEIGPPTPISPANMMPIFTSGASKPVEFSWTPMTNAVGYRLRISHNPYFSSTIVDRRVNTADVIVSGLGEGAYYWLVQSYDAEDKESVESQKNRFTIIPKGQNTTAIDLELDPFMQHGHVIELTGKTEVGARVMVNGREVPMIGPDGSFHYFMPPLPPGESLVTITAQNAKGGVNTVQKKIVIQ